MPFCPKCKYEYIEGVEVCPDCDLKLVKKLHEQKESIHDDDEEWVSLGSIADEAEFQIVKGLLESSGIPVWVRSDIISWAGINRPGDIGEKFISVPASKVEEAREIIKQAQE
ncbi:MAG: DUF2007 domain-containing protein [Armatimonadota bacterium]|nr:DUF2007 domain-containing protein [Armatimonadota bacterium]